MHVELYEQVMRFDVVGDGYGGFMIATSLKGPFNWDQAVAALVEYNKAANSFYDRCVTILDREIPF